MVTYVQSEISQEEYSLQVQAYIFQKLSMYGAFQHKSLDSSTLPYSSNSRATSGRDYHFNCIDEEEEEEQKQDYMSSDEVNVEDDPVEVLELPMDLSMKKEDREWKDMADFVTKLKRHRLSLGLTQGDVGQAVGRAYNCDFSQTTISRFEAMNLSSKNMMKLRPLLQQWLEDSLGMRAAGSTSSSARSSPSLSIRRRKKRTTFDVNVRQALERQFEVNSKPTAEEVGAIADNLLMDREVVRVWFCNRRQKQKRSER